MCKSLRPVWMICTKICLLWKPGDCLKCLKISLKIVCVSIISDVLIAPSQSPEKLKCVSRTGHCTTDLIYKAARTGQPTWREQKSPLTTENKVEILLHSVEIFLIFFSPKKITLNFFCNRYCFVFVFKGTASVKKPLNLFLLWHLRSQARHIHIIHLQTYSLVAAGLFTRYMYTSVRILRNTSSLCDFFPLDCFFQQSV